MRTFVGILAACGVVGCFEPQIRDGQIACEVDESCPGGFVCLGGLCRNNAPGKGDSPGDGDGDGDGDMVDDAPDGGPMPLPIGPKVYTFNADSWTARTATDFFAGSAINQAAVQTSFALCDGGLNIRCWADAEVVTCDFGNGLIDTDYENFGGTGLRDFNPTYTSLYSVDNNVTEILFNRGREWRGYFGELSVDTGAVDADYNKFADSEDGDPDLDQIYDGADGAPASFDTTVWDYIDGRASNDPLHFVRADGERFSLYTSGSTAATGPVPELALVGAPRAADIRAGLQCNAELVVYALD